MTFLIRCFLPQMCFYGFTALATAFLNARRRFAAAAYAPVLNNVVVVCVLLAFTRLASRPAGRTGSTSSASRATTGLLLLLGLGTTAGIAAMALVLVPAVARAGAHLRFVFDWRHAAVRKVVRLSGWTVGYVVANQIALLFVLVLAVDRRRRRRLRVPVRVHLLPAAARPVRGLDHDDDDARARAPRCRRRPARPCATTSPSGLRYMLLVVVPSVGRRSRCSRNPRSSVLVRGGFDAHGRDRHRRHAAGVRARARAVLRVPLRAARLLRAAGHAHAVLRQRGRERRATSLLALALFPALGVQGLALAYSGAYAARRGRWRSCCSARRIGEVLPPAVRATAVRSLVGAAALGVVAAVVARRDRARHARRGRGRRRRRRASRAASRTSGVLAALRSDELRGLLARASAGAARADADV